MREPKPRGAGGQLAPNRITSGEEQQRKLLYHTDLWCLCSRPSEPHGRARGSEFAFWSIPTISSDPLPCGQCFKTHLAASSRRPLQLLQHPPTGHLQQPKINTMSIFNDTLTQRRGGCWARPGWEEVPLRVGPATSPENFLGERHARDFPLDSSIAERCKTARPDRCVRRRALCKSLTPPGGPRTFN